MELIIERQYYAGGTNGALFLKGELIPLCYTIELPWQNNLHQHSCIPEGAYTLVKRYSEKFGWHFVLKNVPGRDLILIHPANNALKELQGCIAPVTTLTGEGTGSSSCTACQKLYTRVSSAMAQKESILLTITGCKTPVIQNNEHENHSVKGTI